LKFQNQHQKIEYLIKIKTLNEKLSNNDIGMMIYVKVQYFS